MPRKITHGLDTILSEIEGGTFTFKRALEDIHMNVESRLAELIGAGGRAAAHRALAQRPGRDRFPALDPRPPSTRIDAALAGLSEGAGREGAGACRDRDAGLHASADRAAGDLRPSSARLCRDGGARPRPLHGCAQAAQRIVRSAPPRSPARRFRSTAT